MAQVPAEVGTAQPEAKLHDVMGVTVYTRTDRDGCPSVLDAIDTDEAKIRTIAHHLQRRGFGVVRQRNPRAGKVFYTLKALWAGDGRPPEDPFETPLETCP